MTPRRLLLYPALLLLGLGIVAVGFVSWLLRTEAGARWALDQAVAATDGALALEEPTGTLGGGFELENVRYESDGLTVTAVAEAAIDVGWLPLGLTVESPRISGLVVDIRSDEESGDSEDPDIASLLESLALPLALTVDDLEVDGVSVLIDGEEFIAFDRLALSAYWHDRIRLSELELSTSQFDALLDAELGLARPFLLAANLDANAQTGFAGLPADVEAAMAVSGDLDRMELALIERNQGVEIKGEIADILRATRRWDLALNVPAFEVPNQEDVQLEDLALATSGWLDAYSIESTLTIVIDERVDVEIDADGSLDGVDIDVLSASHAAGNLRASGRLGFPFDFTGRVSVGDGRPGYLAASVSPDLLLNADAEVQASPKRIEISKGNVEAGGATARFSGEVDLEQEALALDLDWENLHWPLGVPVPDIESPEGNARINGSFAQWAAEASAVVAPKDLPSGRFRITADGAKDNVAVDIVEGDVLGGSLDGSATIAWGDVPSWSASIDAASIETGSLAPAFPGSVTLTLSARSLDDINSVRLDVEKLDGTLLDSPVSGGGVISIAKDRLEADSFALQHGDSTLELDGDYRSPGGVHFVINVEELSDYSRAISGDVRATGALATFEGRPVLEMTAESAALRITELLVDGARVEATVGDGGEQFLQAGATSMIVGERDLGGLDLDLALGQETQALELKVRPLGYTLRVALAGSFDDVSSPATSPWRGELGELSVTTPDDITAALVEPVAVDLSRDTVALDRFCVKSATGSGLCAALDWSDAGLFSLSAELAELPLAVIDAVVQTGFRFDQRLSGNVNWRQTKSQPPTGGANLRFTGGEIASDDFADLALFTDPGLLAFEVEEGKLLSGELDLPMPGTGFVRGSFLLSDVNLGMSSPVQGALAAELSDIDVFAALLPDIDDARGRIDANLTLEGTVGEPVVLGDAALIDATLTYFPLGLRLEDVNLEARIDAEQRIDLNGRFRAGEGVAEVRSSRESPIDSEPGLHFEIRGDNLTVINLPDVNATANVDLGFDYRGGRLDLAGSIDVPYARILPRNLAVTRIDESDDVVIVEGTLPDAPTVDEKPADLEVFGKLSVGLGDNVEVLLDVAEAQVSGNVDFEWNGDLIPIGNGRYNIAGTVQAFGQVLDISEGAIRFPNVPADDPNILVRATREIYGNSEVKRAGILVAGSASRPVVEAYTQPFTTEERALALLLTGNDFNLEQGVGAVDFGTYIAPRLFLSYGVGVFARENIISARYDLKRGFGVRVTSGTKDSGADLTYRIEN